MAILAGFSALIVLGVIFFVDTDRSQPDAGQDEGSALVVHKTAWCSCCGDWASYAEASGFDVQLVVHDDLTPVRERLGVPADLASCHTAEVGGYVIEGHVPVVDIERLLAERPDAVGLALPGMVPNSPGMEVPDGPRPTYRTILFDSAGNRSVFAVHEPKEMP